MNRVFSPLVKSLFMMALAMPLLAAAAPQAPAKADPAKGEVLYNTGDAARNVTACLACHGAAGNSTIAQNPKLAGQHATYLFKQLQEFKSGQRNNPVMTPIAKGMSEEDIRNVSAFLDIQAQKPGAARNKDTVELGKQIFRAGIAEKKVPACAACHSPTGAGLGGAFPRLAGQFQDYTAGQLTAFRTGARKNSAQMTTIARRMSDEEIQAVSDYIAGLK